MTEKSAAYIYVRYSNSFHMKQQNRYKKKQSATLKQRKIRNCCFTATNSPAEITQITLLKK